MKIDNDELQVLEDAADELGLDLRTDYSGRGMYGDECIGIVAGSTGEVIRWFFMIHDLDDMLADRLVEQNMSQDSMAFDIIFYWPSVSVENDESEDD